MFLNGPFPASISFIFGFSGGNTVNKHVHNNKPTTRFEPQTSGVGIARSTNSAEATAQHEISFRSNFWQESEVCNVICDGKV